MTSIPAKGWHVVVEHPVTGHIWTPDVVGDPQRKPRTNGYPRIEIPVRKRERWRDLVDEYPDQTIPCRVWKDGERQPIEELETVNTTESESVLKGRGGIELEERARRSTQQAEKHKLARDLIQNETPYTANVDDPVVETEENVTLESPDTETELQNALGSDDTLPWFVTSDGKLTAYDISFFGEMNGFPHLTASDGEVQQFISSSQGYTNNFELNYTIPDGHVGVAARISLQNIHDWSDTFSLAWGTSPADVRLDGTTVISYGDVGAFGYSPQQGALRNQRQAYAYESSTDTATEETTESNDATAGDMTLLPSSPSEGDEYYWSIEPGTEFDEMELSLSQGGVGDYTITWEYYAEEYDSSDNLIDSGWREIPGVRDGTSGFRNPGSVDWSLEDIRDDTRDGGEYVVWETALGNAGSSDTYIRARLSAFNSLDQQPLGERSKCRGGPFSWRDTGASGQLAAGSHTIEVQGTGSGTAFGFDGVAVHDQRYPKDFPDSINDDGYLEGPQSKPDLVRVETEDNRTIQQVVGGRLEASFDDVSNKQEVAISNDQGSTWTVATNTDTVETDFASGSTRLRARFGISRYGQRSTATPATGFQAQEVDLYDLMADLENTPTVLNQVYDGSIMDTLKALADPESIFAIEIDEDGNISVEWTQPGQRSTSRDVDLSGYNHQVSTEETIHRAVVKGKSQRRRSESFTADHGTAVDLDEDELQRGREVVYNPTDDTQFAEGEDYEIGWQDGTITTLSNGSMTDGDTYEIDYNYRPVGTAETSNAPADPTERVFDFAGVTTDRACEQVALQLVGELDEPLVEASAQLPADDVGWSVVEAIDLDDLPGDEPYEVASIDHTPTGSNLTLESRQSINDAVSEIRGRIEDISGEL